MAVLRLLFFTAWLVVAALEPAQANDSSAAIATGGLRLTKNDRVRMASEVLHISPRLVEVDYVFENTGTDDISTEVAFPLPELNQENLHFDPINVPFPDKLNFVGFEVWIDGHEVKPEIEVRAFGKHGEITADLKRFGIDLLNPNLGRSDTVEALRRLDALSADNSEAVAAWSTRVSFHWQQTFPAGKQVSVRHRYRPVFGNSYKPVNPSDLRTRVKPEDQKLGGQWCFDRSYNAAELKLFDRQYEAAAASKVGDSSDFRIWSDNVQYVLKTGANWHGPIGRFELQIDKGGAELMSTCPIPGLRLERAPYGFRAVANDFTPTSDLDILFVSLRSLGSPSGSGAH